MQTDKDASASELQSYIDELSGSDGRLMSDGVYLALSNGLQRLREVEKKAEAEEHVVIASQGGPYDSRGIGGRRQRLLLKDVKHDGVRRFIQELLEEHKNVKGRTVCVPDDTSFDDFIRSNEADELAHELCAAFAEAYGVTVPRIEAGGLGDEDDHQDDRYTGFLDYDKAVVPGTTINIAQHAFDHLYYLAMQLCLGVKFDLPFPDETNAETLVEWAREAHRTRHPMSFLHSLADAEFMATKDARKPSKKRSRRSDLLNQRAESALFLHSVTRGGKADNILSRVTGSELDGNDESTLALEEDSPLCAAPSIVIQVIDGQTACDAVMGKVELFEAF